MSILRTSRGALGSITSPDEHIEPGPMETEMVARLPEVTVEAQEKMTPVERRLGTAEDLAAVVMWLVGLG